jgi:hypothetical protein
MNLSINNLKNEPYPHIIGDNFTGLGNKLETEFPPLDLFGKEVRMDGDLFSEDENFKSFIKKSKYYSDLVELLTSKELISKLIKIFDHQIQNELDNSELLIDPRSLEITSDALETRSGKCFSVETPKLFPRLDIGYAGKGYGIKNGGRGVHTDNVKRLFSCLLYLNEPDSMIGGEHRLYKMDDNYEMHLKECYSVKQDFFIATLQNNTAFHDVNPILQIEGYRKAIYVGITCTNDLWAPIQDKTHAELTQNRQLPASLFERVIRKIKLR